MASAGTDYECCKNPARGTPNSKARLEALFTPALKVDGEIRNTAATQGQNGGQEEGRQVRKGWICLSYQNTHLDGS